MSFELLVEVLGQLSLELPIDGRAKAAVDVFLGHLPDVVEIGLLFSIAFLSLLRISSVILLTIFPSPDTAFFSFFLLDWILLRSSRIISSYFFSPFFTFYRLYVDISLLFLFSFLKKSRDSLYLLRSKPIKENYQLYFLLTMFFGWITLLIFPLYDVFFKAALRISQYTLSLWLRKVGSWCSFVFQG